MKNIFDNQNLFVLIWKWKIHLFIVGIITIIASTIFSSPVFITPLYKSEARVYPVNIAPHSEESESEQMVEVFNSTDIKMQMIDAFDLSSRYEINKEEPYYQTYILAEYNDKVSCKKTEYESVQIEVLDADPKVACNMVDSVIVFFNRKVKSLLIQKYAEQVESYKNDLVRKEGEIDVVMDTLQVLREKFDLLDYTAQVNMLTEGYTQALARQAGSAAVNEIKGRMGKLVEKGGEFRKLQAELYAKEIQRDTINRRLDKALNLLNKKETYALVVEEPLPADKKSYPTRWLIVLASVLAAELLALLVIYVLEAVNQQKA